MSVTGCKNEEANHPFFVLIFNCTFVVIGHLARLAEEEKPVQVIGGTIQLSSKYHLKYWFEWNGPCLWAGNEEARMAFGYAIEGKNLPLSPDTIRRINDMIQWHDTALNWDYPPDPGPWRQEECDRFNEAAIELYQQIQNELGDNFEVVNCQSRLMEDPELDKYLKDSQSFKRNM